MANPFLLGACIVGATVLKLVGGGLMARFRGMSWRESGIVGFSMNTHATMGLVFASVGIKEGVISNDLFSLLVLVAFGTTLISIFGIRGLAKKGNSKQ